MGINGKSLRWRDRFIRIVRGNPVSTGLDIGNHSVKLVQILHHPSGPILWGAGIHVFRLGTMEDGVIKNEEELKNAISSLVKKTDPTGKHREVNFSLSWSYGVIADRMKIPLEGNQPTEEGILAEASKHSPFDADDLQLDFKILKKDPTNRELEVLLVAAKSKIMSPFLDLIRESGLEPINVDVDAFAVTNSYFHSAPQEDFDKVVCLMNIGEDVTNLTFIKNGVYHSTRDVPTACSHYIEQLEKEFQVDTLEATSILKGRSRGQYEEATYLKCIESSSNSLCSGIDLAFSYFQSSEKNLIIDKLVLSGGGACIDPLPDILADKHNIQVEIADPLSRIKQDKKRFPQPVPRELSATLTVATGLALRSFQ